MKRIDLAGWLLGVAVSPVVGAISAARRSRMFHPTGLVCRASAEPASNLGPDAASVAERLAGPALVRWSSALWKSGEPPDVLGCAIRFTHEPLGVEPQPGDQDLLLATIQRPWSMPFAPLTTRVHDFLANDYFGVSPFEVAPLGRCEWRLVAFYPPERGGSRQERLAESMAAGRATLSLEWAPYRGPLSRPAPDRFTPLLRLRLDGWLELDQRALRFDPFRSGRGLEPVGFVHHMRRAAYRASQVLRPSGR